jgi:mannose-6-phosphate isomerase
MTKQLEPFTLQPVLVERPWGGRRLEAYGKDLPDRLMIGESWEVADLPADVAPHVEDPCSRVSSGPYSGATLADVIVRDGYALLGGAAPTSDGRFPLLVKLLDAREHLSVQVHPPAEYVSTHPGSRLKTESWYVVDADPDATMYLDVEPWITMGDLEDAIGTPRIVPMLRQVAAVPGDFHHLPAGLVHALGAGVLVAEVQTPSDTTFRLYDWDFEYERVIRAIHPGEALESSRLHASDAVSTSAKHRAGARLLERNDHYWMQEHRSAGVRFVTRGGLGPRVIMVIDGRVALGGLDLTVGSTAIVPASAGDVELDADDGAVVLEIGLPT